MKMKPGEDSLAIEENKHNSWEVSKDNLDMEVRKFPIGLNI